MKRTNHTGSRHPILEQCWARTRKKTLAIAYLPHKLDYIAGRYGAKVALMASKELQKPWPTVQKKVEVVRKLWGFTVNTSTIHVMPYRSCAYYSINEYCIIHWPNWLEHNYK